MLAMFTLEQIYPLPYEIEAIKSFDRVFLELQSEQMKKEQKKNKK